MLPTPRAADFAARFSQPYVPGEDWRYKQRPNSVETPIVIGDPVSISQVEITSFKDSVPIEGPQGPPTLLKDGQFGRVPVCANESTLNLPSIQEEVMFRLYCTPSRNIPVQDHEIWVAKVDSIDYPPHGDLPFGIEPYAPLSLLYGDRHFRETGLHLIDEHCKVRRWMRKKLLYETERRQEKKQKLEKRVRLSKLRPNSSRRGDELLKHKESRLVTREAAEKGAESWDRKLVIKRAAEKGISVEEWSNITKKGTGSKQMLPTLRSSIIPLPDTPHPDSSRRLPINSSSSIRPSVTPASRGESQAMSTKTLVKEDVPKKPIVRSFEDWMKKRPSTDSVRTYFPPS